MVSDEDKESDYWVMKTIWLNNIFRVSPMVMISGGVSNDVIADTRPVQNRTKNRTLPQVFMLENIELLVILVFF